MTVVIQRRHLHSGFIPDTVPISYRTPFWSRRTPFRRLPNKCPVSNRNPVRYQIGIASDIIPESCPISIGIRTQKKKMSAKEYEPAREVHHQDTVGPQILAVAPHAQTARYS